MFDRRIFALLALVLLVILGRPAPGAPNDGANDGAFDGTWQGTLALVDTPRTMEVLLAVRTEDGGVRAALRWDDQDLDLAGRRDAATGALVLEGDVDGVPARFDLALDEHGALDGTAERGGQRATLHAARISDRTALPALAAVDFTVPRPVTVDRDGFGPELGARIDALVQDAMDREGMVGWSGAFVVDGRVTDVRSYGWQDFAGRIPASATTMYRWASIAKPMTAAVALQLADEGALDLDRDVRAYVPEFPEKPHVVTARHLILHQSGIVHYHPGLVIRTEREYDVPYPFEDRVLALDMFKESALLFEPGTDLSYSTPAYALLGAVVERAGGARYRDLVAERVCRPAGMTTMQPDFPSRDIPNRTRGYQGRRDGQVVDSGDDDVSWKLAAGGWTSTIEDLARFGIAYMSGALIPDDLRDDAWTSQPVAGGGRTGWGYGIRLSKFGDEPLLMHSGGQLKCSSLLVMLPERRMAIAIMCNTRGTNQSNLARALVETIVAAEVPVVDR